MKAMKSDTDRRSFIARLTGLSALAFVSPLFGGSRLEAEEMTPVVTKSDWDLSRLEDFKGKHRQVFDIGERELSENSSAPDASPLRVPRNYLNAHKEVFGLEHPAINTAVGIARPTYPINATDAIWLKYSLGERWKIKDLKTGTWATRNVFADPTLPLKDKGVSVQALQKRGTLFWQCNNSLLAIAGKLAEPMKMDASAIHAELVAGLLPGVKLVAAHTMAVGLVQERGFSYESI
jgi:hypothetical protein